MLRNATNGCTKSIEKFSQIFYNGRKKVKEIFMSSLGERLSYLRKNANMTQAALGEELNISAQAVSKWEKGLSEPDMDTLIKICDLFSVSMDQLSGKTEMAITTVLDDKAVDEVKADKEEEVEEQKPESAITKIIIGYCNRCKKPIEQREKYVVESGRAVQHIYCAACDKKNKKERAESELSETRSDLKKGWIIGGIVGAVLMVLSLVFLTKFIGVGAGIAIAVVSAYGGVTFVSQMFWADVVPDCMDFFIRAFNMPGIIFSFDIDGIVWAICVKIFLSILSVILSVLCAVLGFVITLLVSLVTFPFALRNVLGDVRELKHTIAVNSK